MRRELGDVIAVNNLPRKQLASDFCHHKPWWTLEEPATSFQEREGVLFSLWPHRKPVTGANSIFCLQKTVVTGEGDCPMSTSKILHLHERVVMLSTDMFVIPSFWLYKQTVWIIL
jgi:hypothetical protein